MTKDDILIMAREASDATIDNRGRESFEFDSYGVEKFANLVAAAEREACALVCEHNASGWECFANEGADDGRYDWKADAGHDCADDIRARGSLK